MKSCFLYMKTILHNGGGMGLQGNVNAKSSKEKLKEVEKQQAQNCFCISRAILR